MAQKNAPVKGDWYSECILIITEFGINMSLEEIQLMDRKSFRNITKYSSSKAAYQYLIQKIIPYY